MQYQQSEAPYQYDTWYGGGGGGGLGILHDTCMRNRDATCLTSFLDRTVYIEAKGRRLEEHKDYACSHCTSVYRAARLRL